MSTSRHAITRNRIKSILETIIDDPTRVHLGMKQFADSDEFLQSLKDDGFHFTIEPAVQDSFEIQTKLFEFHVDILAHFGMEADDDYDFTEAEDVVFKDAQSALSDAALWTDCSLPIGLVVEKPDVSFTSKPMSAVYRIRLDFMGGND